MKSDAENMFLVYNLDIILPIRLRKIKAESDIAWQRISTTLLNINVKSPPLNSATEHKADSCSVVLKKCLQSHRIRNKTNNVELWHKNYKYWSKTSTVPRKLLKNNEAEYFLHISLHLSKMPWRENWWGSSSKIQSVKIKILLIRKSLTWKPTISLKWDNFSGSSWWF